MPPMTSQAAPRESSAPIAALFDEHCDFVFRVLHHYGVDDAVLDDAVQDVFVTAYRRWSTFEGRSSARSWLFGIARRIAHRYRRSARTRARHLIASDRPHEGVDEPFSRANAAHSLAVLLGRIDDDKRVVFVLSEVEGMTAPEVADALGIPVGTVYSRLRAAWQGLGREAGREQLRLRRRLTPMRPPPPADERRRRIWGGIVGGLAPLPSATWATGAAARIWAQTKWMVVGAAVGAGLVAIRVAIVEPPRRAAPSRATADRDGAPASVAPTTADPPVRAAAEPSRAEPPPSTAGADPGPPPPSTPASPTTAVTATAPPRDDLPDAADSLAAELALLRRARAALRDGRPPDALELLDRHAHEFPRGQLVQERRASRIEALCATGRPSDAAVEARALGRDPSLACP